MANNDGGSAFPMIDCGRANSGELIQYSVGGMALRDWFAGQALVGFCQRDSGNTPRVIADMAYKMADAMLEEREK